MYSSVVRTTSIHLLTVKGRGAYGNIFLFTIMELTIMDFALVVVGRVAVVPLN